MAIRNAFCRKKIKNEKPPTQTAPANDERAVGRLEYARFIEIAEVLEHAKIVARRSTPRESWIGNQMPVTHAASQRRHGDVMPIGSLVWQAITAFLSEV
jgi:hypothetical protein